MVVSLFISMILNYHACGIMKKILNEEEYMEGLRDKRRTPLPDFASMSDAEILTYNAARERQAGLRNRFGDVVGEKRPDWDLKKSSRPKLGLPERPHRHHRGTRYHPVHR